MGAAPTSPSLLRVGTEGHPIAGGCHERNMAAQVVDYIGAARFHDEIIGAFLVLLVLEPGHSPFAWRIRHDSPAVFDGEVRHVREQVGIRAAFVVVVPDRNVKIWIASK